MAKKENDGLLEFIVIGLVTLIVAIVFMELVDIWIDYLHNQ